MAIHGFPEFRGIDAARFYNKGYLVSYTKTDDKGFDTLTENSRHLIHFAIVNASDLRPRGVRSSIDLTQESLLAQKDSFNAVIRYADSLYTLIKNDRSVRLLWNNKKHTIKSCSDLNDHKVYILMEMIRKEV